MSRLLRVLVVVGALMALNPVARAENGVLVDHVPGGAESEQVLAVVKQSLIYRRWQIETADGTSVSAALDHMDYDAKIRIALSNGQILYDVTSIRTMRSGPSGQIFKRKDNVPKRWIEFLRHDIGVVVAAMPEKRQ